MSKNLSVRCMRKLSYILIILPIIFGFITFYRIDRIKKTSIIETCIDIPAHDLQYYCTAANSKYYEHLLNLIASIHRHNFEQLGEIAVFDLGLTLSQLNHLSNLQKVTLHQVEKVNQHILTNFKVNENGKKVPGWYSWKPVIIKQAFDLFPSGSAFIWIDAGTAIMQDISPLFEYIKEHGYFFHNGWKHPIRQHITKFVKNALKLQSPEFIWLLNNDCYCVESGIMGFSVSIYESIILPMYNFAQDIRFFSDDGSSKEGLGNARHDQTLSSLLIRGNKLLVFDHYKDPYVPLILSYQNKEVPFYIASLIMHANNKTHICCSRDALSAFKSNLRYLKYKNRVSRDLMIYEQDLDAIIHCSGSV